MPDDALTRLHRYCTDLEGVLATQSVQILDLQKQVTMLEKLLSDARLELKVHRADTRTMLAMLCGECSRKVEGVTGGR